MSTAAAKDARNKGNAAFKVGDWRKAVSYYTRSLNLDETNFVVLSNRSAAYLKLGFPQESLEDAEECIRVKKSYAKGHARKAMALHAMKRYSEEVQAYQKGLKYCPDDKTLLEGMQQAKKTRTANSKASQAARTTEATRKAAFSRKKKAQKSTTLSQFVTETKKNLELQLASIQAQLKMVEELSRMDIEEKMDLLFTLMDKDGGGTIDAAELSTAFRK